MKKIIGCIILCFFACSIEVSSKSEYSVQITVNGIPKNQQTLFIPIKIDTMILDFDKVSLEGLSTQNILAVASTSMDKVGTGIGLLKFDEEGLPATLALKVLLKPQGEGQTSISLLMIADEPALSSKGAQLNEEIKMNADPDNEIEVTEKTDGKKKRLVLSKSKLTINIQRQSQKEESVYIPVIFDKSVLDLDETFGHSIIGPGIAVKSISSGSLQEGGPGIEILLTEVAPLDFSIDVDLIPRKVGKSKVVFAYPEKGRTSLITGLLVDINPTTISVVKK